MVLCARAALLLLLGALQVLALPGAAANGAGPQGSPSGNGSVPLPTSSVKVTDFGDPVVYYSVFIMLSPCYSNYKEGRKGKRERLVLRLSQRVAEVSLEFEINYNVHIMQPEAMEKLKVGNDMI
ncbi:hypothetical protein U0070_019818 [Myodes glareolus]|uniref:Uncharacterized protein n=1 Tax=Myodes glareolus TaxID=447135 RepID=A0AAW0IEU4_MYOGA